MKVHVTVIAAVLIAVAPVRAGPHNPFKIVAHDIKGTVHDMFRDPAFATVSWTDVASATADLGSTANLFARCPTCYEAGSFGHRGRSMATISAEGGAFTFATIVIAHAWRTHVHNTILKQAWPGEMSLDTGEHIRAVLHNINIPPPPENNLTISVPNPSGSYSNKNHQYLH